MINRLKIRRLCTVTTAQLKAITAFTLAEVLLVVAIIGAVSVLTVNNAVKSTNSVEKITQLKKTYDILQGAFMASIGEAGDPYKWGAYGSGDESDTINNSIIQTILEPHLKLQKTCRTSSGCWKSTVIANISNDPSEIDSSSYWYKGILANGASFAMKFTMLDNNVIYDDSMQLLSGEYPDEDQEVAIIYVDVDGPDKGPSKAGDDVFTFALFSEHGLYPLGYKTEMKSNNGGSISFTCPSIGEYCTAWALYKGNEDYFKCPDVLSWTDTAKSHCKIE